MGKPAGYFQNGSQNGSKALTTSEAEVLRRLAAGETVKDSADSWGTSGRWVRYTLMRARDRLQAATTEHASRDIRHICSSRHELPERPQQADAYLYGYSGCCC